MDTSKEQEATNDTIRRQRPPFTMLENRVVDDESLSLYAVAAYVALCRYADSGQRCWPSFTTIARKARISRRKAVDAVKELVAHGYLVKEHRQREGTVRAESNLYTIVWSGGEGDVLGGAQYAPGGAQHALGVVHAMHRGGAQHALEQDIAEPDTGEREGEDRSPDGADIEPPEPDRYDTLCEQYGKRVVDDYIQRVKDWGDANGKPTRAPVAKAGLWLARDEQEGKIRRATPEDPRHDFSHLRSAYAKPDATNSA